MDGKLIRANLDVMTTAVNGMLNAINTEEREAWAVIYSMRYTAIVEEINKDEAPVTEETHEEQPITEDVLEDTGMPRMVHNDEDFEPTEE